MTADRWREVTRIYAAVANRPLVERRAALMAACGDHAALRRQVESLLAESGALVIDSPAAAVAGSMLAATASVVAPNTMIGASRVENLIGVGGMGEVYRGRDTKLNRDVAIKILPATFASDPDRLGRFRRAARVLASLNHPNIAAIYGVEDADGVHALVLERKDLVDPGMAAQYVDGGFLVYAVDGALRAARFDADRLETIGQPATVIPQVVSKVTMGVHCSVSTTGALVYVPGPMSGFDEARRTLVWVDRRGREQPLGLPEARAYAYARLSPDGTRVAVAIRDQDDDIRSWDLARRTLTRLTTCGALDTSPVWMPDGRTVVFGSQEAGSANLFVVNADATEPPRQITSTNQPQIPTSITLDGKSVIFWSPSPNGLTDLGVHHLGDKPDTEMLLTTPFGEQNGDLSPDDRWLAYQSNDSG